MFNIFFREWFIHSVIAKVTQGYLFEDTGSNILFLQKILPTLPVIKINYKVYTCYYEYNILLFLEVVKYTR